MFKWFPKTLAICAIALALGACTTAMLKPAPAISVPPGLSRTQVRHAVVAALKNRKWTLDTVREGRIRSTLHLREHTATVRVTFDTQSVDIAYVSSTNLNYKKVDGRRYIHRNYNGWIHYLEQDIQRNLQNTEAMKNQ